MPAPLSSVYSCTGRPSASAPKSRPSVPSRRSGPGGSASGGTNIPAGSTSPALPPDTCPTTPTFPGWCQLKPTTCKVDTDCPATWTCTTTGPYAVEPVATTGTAAGTPQPTRGGVYGNTVSANTGVTRVVMQFAGSVISHT